MRRWVTAVLLVAGWAVAQERRAGIGRIRPPVSLPCDRNRLTSFAGSVTGWTRGSKKAVLHMHTDAETKETFTLRFPAAEATRWFLLGGEKFQRSDWRKIELAPGKLRPGIAAVVWVCEGSANPVVDWRLPPR